MTLIGIGLALIMVAVVIAWRSTRRADARVAELTDAIAEIEARGVERERVTADRARII